MQVYGKPEKSRPGIAASMNGSGASDGPSEAELIASGIMHVVTRPKNNA